jgi:hypothetical protein
MKLNRSLSLLTILSTLFSVSCSNANSPSPSSSAGALVANRVFENDAPRPFGRHTLNAAGSNYLREFIRSDVRARLDEEPVGDTDGGYDAATSDQSGSSDQPQVESGGDAQGAEESVQPQPGESEEGYASSSRLDTLKYSWAKKAFGDAVKASPTNNGVIVLYADENYYEVDRLMGFVEEGRNQIVHLSEIGGERIQVVFGGYRAVPQVELWVVAEGAPMPEFKPDDRSKPESEN